MAEVEPAKKPLVWLGSTRKVIQKFPEDVQDEMGFALYQAEMGGKHIAAKPLRGFGGGSVLEVVADDDGSTYRAVYTVKFRSAIYVLHAFQKKSRKGIETPKHEIDLIQQRLRQAAEHHRHYYENKKA